MRLKLKVSAVASVIAVSALSVQGLSPATAAEPEAAGEPQATASPTPALPAAAEEEPEDVPVPPAEDTEGLLDVAIGDDVVPVSLTPYEEFSAATVVKWNLGRSGYTTTGDRYGGSAVGAFIDADIAGLLKITSRRLALSNVDKSGGVGNSHEVAGLDLGGFFLGATLKASGIESSTRSTPLHHLEDVPSAEALVRIARLDTGTLLVEGLDVTAFAGQTHENRTSRATATMHVTRLKSGTKEYNDYDVPPNTTHTIPGLGKVVLNEQKITELPGDRYSATVNAVRITLSTASLGLPVGTNIYLGSAEAIYHQ